MTSKVLYIFNQEIIDSNFVKKTLFVDYREDFLENFKCAIIRRKILDYTGAILFLNKCVSQNLTFVEAYNEKFILFFELNQFENGVLNFFKSYLIETEIRILETPTIYEVLNNYLSNCEKSKARKIISYLRHYSYILKKQDNFNEFAERLISFNLFEIDNKDLENLNNYSNFLLLKER